MSCILYNRYMQIEYVQVFSGEECTFKYFKGKYLEIFKGKYLVQFLAPVHHIFRSTQCIAAATIYGTGMCAFVSLTHGLVSKTQPNLFNYEEGRYGYFSEIRQAFLHIMRVNICVEDGKA